MNKPVITEEWIYQQDTPVFRFTVTEDDVAVSLVGATCRFSARTEIVNGTTTYIFNKTETDGSVAGIVDFEMTQADTATAGIYTGELEIKDSNNKIIVADQFELTILERVFSSSSSSSSSST